MGFSEHNNEFSDFMKMLEISFVSQQQTASEVFVSLELDGYLSRSICMEDIYIAVMGCTIFSH
jgi:hypothetical protein